jgi:hypothetical protein
MVQLNIKDKKMQEYLDIIITNNQELLESKIESGELKIKNSEGIQLNTDPKNPIELIQLCSSFGRFQMLQYL